MFENLAIGIKTFLRDEHLSRAIQGIEKNFPGAQMIIVDDGRRSDSKDEKYHQLQLDGHVCTYMPFDSGFGAKSNKMVSLLERPLLLIGSDDFIFDAQAADSVTGMMLATDHGWDVASGRVNNRQYEFDLEVTPLGANLSDGYQVREVPITYPTYVNPVGCDLTVNFSVITREVFRWVKWDNDVKIGGGEHGAFFFDCFGNNIRVGLVTGCNINEDKSFSSAEYLQYRCRALNKARPCFDRRYIKKYILGTGEVDYDVTNRS
jgi:hypothetical protein